MDLETSLYDQELEWGNREWMQLFGGQLLTFPEAPLSSCDVGAGSVLQLEQSASAAALDGVWSQSGPLTLGNQPLQDSAWTHSADVGDSWELCQSSLGDLLSDKKKSSDWLMDCKEEEPNEKDSPDWLNDCKELDAQCDDIYSCSIELELLSAGDSDNLSFRDVTDMITEAPTGDLSSAAPGNKIIVDDLDLKRLLWKSGIMVESSQLGCMGDENKSRVDSKISSAQKCVSIDNKTIISDEFQAKWLTARKDNQTTTTVTSRNQVSYGTMISSRHTYSVSELKSSGSELEEHVDVDLIDGDEASIFKLIEDLERDGIAENHSGIVNICPAVSMMQSTTTQDSLISKPTTQNKITIVSDGKMLQDVPGQDSVKVSKAESSVSSPQTLAGLPKYSSVLQDHLYPTKLPAIPARSRKSDGLKTVNSARTTLPEKQKSETLRYIASSRPESETGIVKLKCNSTMSVGIGYSTTTIDNTEISLDSCSSISNGSLDTIESKYKDFSLLTKVGAVNHVAAVPYCVSDRLTERRQRKKEQNCRAALRYRQKKREEKGHTMTEVEKLELANEELRVRADELEKEINYLKDLLEEISKR